MDDSFCALHGVRCCGRKDVSFLLCSQYVRHGKGHPPAAAFTKRACMSASCMQATATIARDARSWHCQVRAYVNDLHEVCYLTATCQLQ